MDLAKILKVVELIGPVVEPMLDKWRGQAPTGIDDIAEDIDSVMSGLLEPFKDGFQVHDIIALKDPVMTAIMCITGVMELEGSGKKDLAIAAYNRVVDNFDPEVDFDFPWWASWAENWAEEAVDKILVTAVRDLGPALVEFVYTKAAAKFPAILG